MSLHGLLVMIFASHVKAFLARLQPFGALLRAKLAYSFFPVVVHALPAVISSCFMPNWLTWFVLIPTYYCLYEFAKRNEPIWFAMNHSIAHIWIVLPWFGFITTWALLLHVFHRQQQLAIVGPVAMLYLLAILPALRFPRSRTVRFVTLDISFSALATVVTIINTFNLWSY